MGEAFVLLVAIGVAAFVGYPLLEGRKRTAGLGNHRAVDLEERKKAIYAQIKDIDFDYATGKLSDEDYQELRARYKREAASVLREIDEVQARRSSAKRGRKRKSASQRRFCPTCGLPAAAADNFCMNCGTRLS